VKAEEATSFKGRAEWSEWLSKNHGRYEGIWLLIYKKSVGGIGLGYEDALEVAICFGWIDGKLRRIDDRCHAIRFTPRRPRGIWSENNRKRAERMIREGRMRAPGLKQVEDAKKDGRWDAAFAPKNVPPIPADLRKALRDNLEAWEKFRAFANSYKSSYIHWVLEAKTDETRSRRIREVVKRSRDGRRPGV
jgi:uncharacterized protein YdeI (YjbR/CyaY-like superfamily)